MTTARPDWYPDPSDSTIERWWNGRAWGAQIREAGWSDVANELPASSARALVEIGSSPRPPIWMGEYRAS